MSHGRVQTESRSEKIARGQKIGTFTLETFAKLLGVILSCGFIGLMRLVKSVTKPRLKLQCQPCEFCSVGMGKRS